MNALNLFAASATLGLALLSGEDHGDAHAASAPAAKKTAAAAASGHGEHGAEDKAPESPRKSASAGSSEKSPAKAADKSPAKPAMSDSASLWNELAEGNRRFVEGKPQERELLKDRAEAVQGEKPSVMVLSCADSRVTPEMAFDQGLGDLYVVRVAGNVAEPSAIGSLEYGCETLHAKVLVILGHEKCSAVASAAGGEWVPSPNMFEITKRITPALANVPNCRDASEMSLRQVRSNVEQSYADLLKQSPLLAKAVTDGELTIVRAVYRMKTGEIERIDGGKPMPSVASTKEDAGH